MHRTAVITAVTVALYIVRKRREREERRKVWVRPWLLRRPTFGHFETLLQELAREDSAGFHNFLRIDPTLFFDILERVSERIQKQTTSMRKSLCPALRLGIALRYLATGCSYKTLEYGFRVANNTISRIIPEVCNAIFAEFGEEFLKVCFTWYFLIDFYHKA